MSLPRPTKASDPHVSVIVNQSARRLACDRCHTQKLRCTKGEENEACVRCHRLKKDCVWSPPGRSGRPGVQERNKYDGASGNENSQKRQRTGKVSLSSTDREVAAFLTRLKVLRERRA